MERLHRSRRNKMLLGVCGGLSEYMHIDVVIIRVVSILALLMGWGLIVYIVAALIMPEDKGYTPDNMQWGQERSRETGNSTYQDPGARTGNSTYSEPEVKTGSKEDFVNDFYNDADNWDRPAKYNTEKNRLVLGAILVGVGVMVLGKQFMPSLFQLKFLLPLFLVIIGGIIVYQGKK